MLLGAPGLTSSNKKASSNKCIASSNKCLTSSNKKLRSGLLALLLGAKDATIEVGPGPRSW